MIFSDFSWYHQNIIKAGDQSDSIHFEKSFLQLGYYTYISILDYDLIFKTNYEIHGLLIEQIFIEIQFYKYVSNHVMLLVTGYDIFFNWNMNFWGGHCSFLSGSPNTWGIREIRIARTAMDRNVLFEIEIHEELYHPSKYSWKNNCKFSNK